MIQKKVTCKSIILTAAGLSVCVIALVKEDVCKPSLADTINIKDTMISINTYVYNCSAIDNGRMEIVLESETPRIRRDILNLSETVISDVAYNSSTRTIVITLPNVVDIDSFSDVVGDFKVILNFIPANDPSEREAYQRRVRNPSDPKGRAWFDGLGPSK